jgi:hypothetical protein
MPRRTVKRTQRRAHGGKFLSSARRKVKRLTNKAKKKVRKVSKKLSRGVKKQIHKHRKPLRKVVGKLSRKKLRNKKFFDNLYSLNSIVKEQKMRNEQCNPNWDYLEMGARPMDTSDIALENRRQRLIRRNQENLHPLSNNPYNNLLQLSEFINPPQSTPQPKIDLMKQLNLLTPSSSANLVATNSVNQALMNPTPQNIQNAQEVLRLSQMPSLPSQPVPLVPQASLPPPSIPTPIRMPSLPPLPVPPVPQASLPPPPVPRFPSSLPSYFPRSYQDMVSMDPDFFKTGSDMYRPQIPSTPPSMIPAPSPVPRSYQDMVSIDPDFFKTGSDIYRPPIPSTPPPVIPMAPPPPMIPMAPPPPPVKPQKTKGTPKLGLMDELKKPKKLKKTAKQSKKLSKRDEMMEAIQKQGMKNRMNALQSMEQHMGNYKKMGNNFQMNTMMQHAVADALHNKQSVKKSNSDDWSVSSRSSALKPKKKKKAKSSIKQKKKQNSQGKKSTKKQTPPKVFPKVNVNNELANNPMFAMYGDAAHSDSSSFRNPTSSFSS